MKLGELNIGDRFYPKSQAGKSTPYFIVLGEPQFNVRHGSPTRMCLNLYTNKEVSKSCRLEIIKSNPPC